MSQLGGGAATRAEQESLAEAIGTLTARNRAHPEPDLEARLVELRCDPRLSAPTGAGIEPWPRRLDDPFPDVAGRPPEVEAHGLTMELLGGAVLHHGCLLVRGLVGPEHIEPLREAIDGAIAGRRSHVSGAPPSDTIPWYRPCAAWDELTPDRARKARRYTDRGGSAVHLCDSPRAVFRVLEALHASPALTVISEYLGEPAVLSANKSMLRRVPPEATPSWHQDGSFMGPRTRAVNSWISLSDCGEGRPAPGLALLPHRLDTSVRGEVYDGDIVFTPEELNAASQGNQVVRPVFAPGDALLFDELLAHANGGGDGSFTRERYTLEAWMFAPSHLPDGYVPIAVI